MFGPSRSVSPSRSTPSRWLSKNIGSSDPNLDEQSLRIASSTWGILHDLWMEQEDLCGVDELWPAHLGSQPGDLDRRRESRHHDPMVSRDAGIPGDSPSRIPGIRNSNRVS